MSGLLQKEEKESKNISSGKEIIASHQQPKIDNKNKNRTLIIGFSNCGKTCMINYILLLKQEPLYRIIMSLNQYPNIKAQTSDEFRSLEIYENSLAVFDDMLLSKQESHIDLFFTRGRHKKTDSYYISQSSFDLPKNTGHNISYIIVLFKQTRRDIILLFHDIAGLNMNLEEWKQLCRKAGEIEYDCLQKDRFAKIGVGRCTIRNCNETKYTECTPETKPFYLT